MSEDKNRLHFDEGTPEDSTSGNGAPAKPLGFAGKGGATERVSLSPVGGNEQSAVCDDAVPKSKAPHAKFREYSAQAPPSERLRHDPPPPANPAADNAGSKKAAREPDGLNHSKLRMEKTGAKLEKATLKKAKQKPYKRPGMVKTVRQAATYEAWRYAHGKIYQAEQENAGVEAAHKTELAGERGVRATSRFIKRRNRTRPARRVQKWERRDIKAKAGFQYKKAVQEHPELCKNALSRFLQKRRLKKKQAKEAAKRGAKAAKKTAVTTEKLAVAVGRFAVRHPVLILIIAAAFILIVTMQSCMGTVTMVGNGMTGMVGAASYVAADTEIDRAELAYTEWETDLQLEIGGMETARPGYDEYRYTVGTIGHDPYALMAFLTAVYGDFTYSGVESVLRGIFDEQYTLTTTELTETRETENEDGETVTEEITVLEISLAVRPFADLLHSRMNAGQVEQYTLLVLTKGNRQYLKSPFPVNWLPSVTSNYGYRVHPLDGIKNYHTGVDIALPEGTVICSGQAGTVTLAENSGDYGIMVIIDDGSGLVSKYAHCSALLVSVGQTVQAGDAIAKVGNTGASTGPHLHMEVLKNGQYLNPLYFAITNDFEQ